MDGALKGATSVSQVLEQTLPVLMEDTLDASPRPLAALPERLLHFAGPLPLPAAAGRQGEDAGSLPEQRAG